MAVPSAGAESRAPAAVALSLLGRGATIELVDGSHVSGLVYAVDPETFNIVLCSLSEQTSNDVASRAVRLSIVFAHAVQDITEDLSFAALSLADVHLISRTRLATWATPAATDSDYPAVRLQRLCSLLDRYRLPYTKLAAESGRTVVEIFGSLRIEPPYAASSCVCVNELVLSRIQELVSSLDAADA